MINGLKPYVRYKESGVSWLGKTPITWDVRRLKLLLREVDSRSSTGREQLLRVSQYTGVTERRSADGSDVPDTRAASLKGYKRVAVDDLVINIMLAWNGSMGVSRYNGIVSPAYCVYRFRPGTVPWYYHELLRLPAYKGRIKGASTGVVESRLRLYSDDLGQIEALLPPPEDQTAIVRFLNHASTRIERAIRAKKKLIALLNEQKQAIIHRAVTRGLDSNVSLKSSGIPWLGDVPQNWEVAPLKTRVLFREGPGIMLADFRETGIPLLRIASLLSKEKGLHGCNYLDPQKVRRKWSHFAVQPGDYILNGSSSASTILIRKASDEMLGAIPYTGLLRIWPKDSSVCMEYIAWLFQSPLIQAQLTLSRSGVGIAHFGPTHLKRMWISLPPKSNQESLVDFLRTETANLGSAIAKQESEIALFREYRTRLTSDVVTGQLDVRGAAAKLSTEFNAPAEPEIEPADSSEAEEPEEIEG